MGIFHIDTNGATVPLKPYWNFCVGSCHAATADQKNMQLSVGMKGTSHKYTLPKE